MQVKRIRINVRKDKKGKTGKRNDQKNITLISVTKHTDEQRKVYTKNMIHCSTCKCKTKQRKNEGKIRDEKREKIEQEKEVKIEKDNIKEKKKETKIKTEGIRIYEERKE